MIQKVDGLNFCEQVNAAALQAILDNLSTFLYETQQSVGIQLFIIARQLWLKLCKTSSKQVQTLTDTSSQLSQQITTVNQQVSQ